MKDSQEFLKAVSYAHVLVGMDANVCGKKLKIKSLIARSKFGVVVKAEDDQGDTFALKLQFSQEEESIKEMEQEIRIMREMREHSRICKLVGASQQTRPNGTKFLVLTEYCPGGSVADLMKLGPLRPEQVLIIFYGACAAVQHLHDRPAPITHGNLKVENLLVDGRGCVKLWDFDNATIDWTDPQRTMLKRVIQGHTTPMYRAPEALDIYHDYTIGHQQDVWALGCILFSLCYGEHPFKGSEMWQIIFARYRIPANDNKYHMFKPLIEGCLISNPDERKDIYFLTETVEALAEKMDVETTQSVFEVKAAASSQVDKKSIKPKTPEKLTFQQWCDKQVGKDVEDENMEIDTKDEINTESTISTESKNMSPQMNESSSETLPEHDMLMETNATTSSTEKFLSSYNLSPEDIKNWKLQLDEADKKELLEKIEGLEKEFGFGDKRSGIMRENHVEKQNHEDDTRNNCDD